MDAVSTRRVERRVGSRGVFAMPPVLLAFFGRKSEASSEDDGAAERFLAGDEGYKASDADENLLCQLKAEGAHLCKA